MTGDIASDPRRASDGRRGGADAPRARAGLRGNTLQAGDVLADRYRVDEFVGSGGMASVFRATDQALGRTVAIKSFTPGTAGRGDEARQVSETRLLASLSHHALVTLFDAHLPERGDAFLVMEYIDGGTLDSRLLGGAISDEDATSLARELGEALHVVHGAGIIHRDVKPSNILLRPALTPQSTLRPTLADFGIAYLVDTTRLTAPGTAIGTAAYLAPEQVRGAPPTTASDIYSLGLVLIEALTGRRAFAQQTPVEAIAARLSIQPEIPASLGPGWRSLLTDMTARDPEQRPTALEVASRARSLDVAPSDPAVTALAVDTGGGADGGAASVAPVSSKGAVSPAPTLMLPTEALTDVPPVPPEVAPLGTRAEAGQASSPTRVRLWLLVLVALVVAGVLAVALWNANLPSEPAQPDLPQVGEPLDTHLQDLLDEVTP
ncbi:serine/threonine-protein kinase [Microbacterium lacus]|uniref:serine/threonine-protein kinase n=1 Tax=Microbacterium lacus TaxID=415217 RepID=UPI000C2BD72A|nr:serine/threonine-protein kinase [Microbacterium lacus]